MIKKLLVLTSLVVVTTFQANSMDRHNDPAIADLQKVRTTLTQTIDNLHKPAQLQSLEKDYRQSAFIIDKFLWEKEGKLSPHTTPHDKLKLFYEQNKKDINTILALGTSMRQFLAINDPSKYGNVPSAKVADQAEFLVEDLAALKKLIENNDSDNKADTIASALKRYNQRGELPTQQANASILDNLWTKAHLLINFDML